MFETLAIFPLSFWLASAVLFMGCIAGLRSISDSSGLPMLVVLATVAVWYFGDAFYNDYGKNHALLFRSGTLQAAWLQVALFLMVFCVLTPALHKRLNQRNLVHGSGVLRLFKQGVAHRRIQQQLTVMAYVLAGLWIILTFIATLRLGESVIYYLFPFLGRRAEPWGRLGVGSGFDALLTVAFYFQQMVAALSGVVAALSTERRLRFIALCLCLFAWPYFIFGDIRNSILAVIIPGTLAWTFLRLRGGLVKKALVLTLFFVVVNAWFAFVGANRTEGSIAKAFAEKGFSLARDKKRHEGLNMFEELCWANSFFEAGTFNPNWGSRYWAEIVNPIPRSLWPGKPMIGIDYAIARGCGNGDTSAGSAGVFATMSTGLIGQGVVNFGRILGPAFAAFLMSLWVVLLARLDLFIEKPGYLGFYPLGLILTFNLGRDITLITLYPFVFGMIGLSVAQRFWGSNQTERPSRQKKRDTIRRFPMKQVSRRRGGMVVRPALADGLGQRRSGPMRPNFNHK